MLAGLSARLEIVSGARRRASGLFTGAVMLSIGTVLSGCGSSDPVLNTLAAVPGAPAAAQVHYVEVRTPVVAASLDRDRIVREDKGYQLSLAEHDAWSEALPTMIGKTLTRDLAVRLPGTVVYAQNDALTATPQSVVELTVTGFEKDPQGHARIDALLSVRPEADGVGASVSVPIALDKAPDGSGTTALVAALSDLLGQVADQAAEKIREMPPPAPAAAAVVK